LVTGVRQRRPSGGEVGGPTTSVMRTRFGLLELGRRRGDRVGWNVGGWARVWGLPWVGAGK